MKQYWSVGRFVALCVFSLSVCLSTGTAAIDLRKTTKPKVIKPADQKVKRYTITKNKKYATTVNKNQKLELKKQRKKAKKRAGKGMFSGNGRTSNSDGKKLDQKLALGAKGQVIDTKRPVSDAPVDPILESDEVTQKKLKKKKKVTQGQVNKHAKAKREENVPLAVTPAGQTK